MSKRTTAVQGLTLLEARHEGYSQEDCTLLWSWNLCVPMTQRAMLTGACKLHVGLGRSTHARQFEGEVTD